MTFTNLAPPSRNPTNSGTMTGMLTVVLRKFLQHVDDMLPAEVIAYDRATNMASVQPLINMVTTLNTVVPRAAIAQVPVLQMGAGGFMLNFPVKPGNLGWIKSNDRDISLFKQIWKAITPASRRFHSFEDSIFIPSVLTNFTITDADSENVVLQAIDASVRISLGAGAAVVTDESGYSQNTAAILDVQSTTKALKIPSMTEGERDAIPSPVGGMMVYVNSAPTPHFSFYTDGTGWS